MILPGVIASSGGVASSFESIATTTVGSGGTASITFSSMGTGFTHLQIRGIAREYSGGGANTLGMSLRFNADSGANYTASHVLYGTGATAASAASGTSQTSIQVVNYPQSAATSNAFGIFVIDILDFNSANKYKTVRGLGGYDGNDTNGIVTFRSGAWMNTAAVTSITLLPSSSWAQYSSFALYGVKA